MSVRSIRGIRGIMGVRVKIYFIEIYFIYHS